MARGLPRRTVVGLLLLAAALVVRLPSALQAEDNFIIVQSTTSTQNSGAVRSHSSSLHQGNRHRGARRSSRHRSGPQNAENGDGDVVLVHSKLDEEKFGPDYLKFITDDDWPF